MKQRTFFESGNHSLEETTHSSSQKISGHTSRSIKNMQIVTAENIMRSALRENLSRRTEPDIDSALRVIQILKGQELFLLLKKMNYFIFDWAIEHENVILLEALFNNLESHNHFLLLEHDNYKPLRQFLQQTLSLPPKEYQQVALVKKELLAYFVNLGADEILFNTLIQNLMHQPNAIVQESKKLFQSDLDTIFQTKHLTPGFHSSMRQA